jgi:hypothetical protein
MQRPPQPPSWLTRTAAIWRSDGMFRLALMVLAALLMTLLGLHT